MTELIITEDDIFNKLCNLKTGKSPGLDMIHPQVLFEMRDVIKYQLCLIYNKNLHSRSWHRGAQPAPLHPLRLRLQDIGKKNRRF